MSVTLVTKSTAVPKTFCPRSLFFGFFWLRHVSTESVSKREGVLSLESSTLLMPCVSQSDTFWRHLSQVYKMKWAKVLMRSFTTWRQDVTSCPTKWRYVATYLFETFVASRRGLQFTDDLLVMFYVITVELQQSTERLNAGDGFCDVTSWVIQTQTPKVVMTSRRRRAFCPTTRQFLGNETVSFTATFARVRYDCKPAVKASFENMTCAWHAESDDDHTCSPTVNSGLQTSFLSVSFFDCSVFSDVMWRTREMMTLRHAPVAPSCCWAWRHRSSGSRRSDVRSTCPPCNTDTSLRSNQILLFHTDL